MLHIVIFDEIDAICKTRGSVRDGTGVSDSVVNQLLSKIDGVDSLNNVLIIGMTNRKVVFYFIFVVVFFVKEGVFLAVRYESRTYRVDVVFCLFGFV